MKIGFLFPLIALIFSQQAYALIINEVMYNPSDANEWIEIYNNGPELDFSNFILTDNYETDNIICCSFEPNCSLIIYENSFAIITDQDTTFYNNFTTNATKLCIDDNSIGNGLGNTADTIIISNTNETFDNLTYDGSLAMKGYSIEKFDNKWRQSIDFGGSPGKENPEREINYIISFNYNLHLGTNENFFSVSKEDCEEQEIIFYYNISNDISEPFFENSITETIGCNKNIGTIEITDYGNYFICASLKNLSICRSFSVQQEACSASLTIETDKEFYSNNETVKFKLIPEIEIDSAFIIEYWIEDLLGNVVKSKYNTTSISEKSWKLDFDEKDAIFSIKANLYTECINATAEKIFFALNNITYDYSPKIEITEYPENATFGDMIRVKISASRGNSTKSALSIYIADEDEKVSEETKLTLYTKYETEFLIPVLLDNNCDEKKEDKNYEFVAEGLDLKIKKDIFISGKSDLCPDEEATSSSNSSSSKSFFYELLPHPKEIEGNKFEMDLKIENQDDNEHRALIQSYVYKGSVTYSGDKNETQQEFFLEPNAIEIVHFDYYLDEKTKSGDYKVKFKIYKDSLKTPYELTENITLLNFTQEINAADSAQLTITESPIIINKTNYDFNKTNETFYSDNGEAKQKYFYIVGFGFVLLIVMLGFLFKKDYSFS